MWEPIEISDYYLIFVHKKCLNLPHIIYSLPNGKVIQLTVEEFLELTDEDIQFMISMNAGNVAMSPFYGSVIRKTPCQREEDEVHDTSIDYDQEYEELAVLSRLLLDEVIPDDFLDFPDEPIAEQD